MLLPVCFLIMWELISATDKTLGPKDEALEMYCGPIRPNALTFGRNITVSADATRDGSEYKEYPIISKLYMCVNDYDLSKFVPRIINLRSFISFSSCFVWGGTMSFVS